MKIRSILAATLLIGSSLAFAQTCPPTGSTCLVPSRAMSNVNTYVSSACPTTVSTAYPTTSISTACPTVATTLPFSGGMISQQPLIGLQPVVSTQPFYVIPQAGIQPTTMASGQYAQPISAISSPLNVASACGNISPDTSCLLNQVVGLRSDIQSLSGNVRAMALESRGQQLVSRINALMANEMLFRQQLALNPNLPNARQTAFALSQQADALNNDLADYNRELSLIPVNERPFIASSMNSFTVAYWNPTIQRFNDYRNSFAAASLPAYQPAFASNPWLQGWQSNFQASLGNVGTGFQNYASVSWWTPATSAVAGSMECLPANPNAVMIPSNSVIFIPANALGTPTMGGCPMPPVPAATSICPVPTVTTTPVCPPATLTTPPSTMGTNFYNTTTPPAAGTIAPAMPEQAMPMPTPMPMTTPPVAPAPPSRGGTGY